MKRTEHTQKWLDALRSGEYKQCRGMLGGKELGEYCCLAVGMEVLGTQDMDDLSMLGIDFLNRDCAQFVKFNDADMLSFPQIADEIEKMLDVSN